MADRFILLLTMPYTDRLADLIVDPPRQPETDSAQTDRKHKKQQTQKRLASGLHSERFHEALTAALADEELAAKEPAGPNDYEGFDGWARRAGQPVRSAADLLALRCIEASLLAARRWQLRRLKDEVREVRFDMEAARHAARLVYSTWTDTAYAQAVGGAIKDVPIPSYPALAERLRDHIDAGASPRAAIALRAMSKSYVWATRGPGQAVGQDDIDAVAPLVLRHRILLKFQSALAGKTTDWVIEEVVKHWRKTR
jgi:hypothetical protein